MTTRLRLPSAVFVILTSVFLTAVTYQPAYASSRSACELELLPVKSDTLRALRERNTERLSRYIAQHPMPGFTDMAVEVQKEQVGELAPRALQQILGPEFKSVSSPAPSVTMDTAVNLHEEGKSIPLHVDIPWHGRRTSTTVYASLPKTIEPRGHQYIVGPEYPAVIFHLHGGGTPTATGKNAMSIAQKMEAFNIPVLAPDLPGHGRATRKMQGLMSAEEQVNWILEVIKKTVHPGVKVILSGHSWGGEFAEYMYRHSDEEKYKQIALFFVLSAPVDVSLGGDERLKYEWDEYYERNYAEFKERIAPADFEFQDNSHYHGKISETGSYFTYGTHMDFVTPPLSSERQKQLKPKIVIVGDADGLVYVGAEKQYAIAHGGLIGRSRYILMSQYKTWKSEKEGGKLYPTGHNIWDAVNDEGKFVVYSLMAAETMREAGPHGMGSDDADAAAVMLSNIKRQWDNNFVFRQMVMGHEEYVLTPTPERTEMGKRKLELEIYLGAVSEQEEATRKHVEAKLKEALAPIRQELGIHPSMSIERATREVDLPELTEARRQILTEYLEKTSKIGSDLQNNSAPDARWESDLADLKRKFVPILVAAGVPEFEGYKAKFDEINAIKGKLNPEMSKLKSELSRLHQAYTEAVRGRQKRFAAEKDRLIELIPKPDMVLDVKSAQNELAADRKPASVVSEFLKRASAAESAIRQVAGRELAQNIQGIPRPRGVSSVAAAKAERENILERENYTYAPSTNQVLVEAAERVRRVSEKRAAIIKGDAVVPGLDALERSYKDVMSKRAIQSRAWDNAWKADKGALTSARLFEHTKKVTTLLETYRESYLKHEHLKGIWMRELRKTGLMSEAALLNPPEEIKQLRAKYQAEKLEFEAARDQIDNLRWEEALAGRLEGPPKLVLAATNAARELWGTSVTEPSPTSLVARVRVIEAELEKARNDESIARQELERAQWIYSEEMLAAGERVPFTVTRVAIREELEQDYAVLLRRLRTDSTVMSAFRSLMAKYTEHQSLLRVEAQSKDSGNY